MERTSITNIVRVFKNKNNSNCRITEVLENYLMETCEGYTDAQIMEVVSSVEAKNISDIINPTFLKFYFGQKEQNAETVKKNQELEAQIQKQKEFKLEEQQSNMSLGILEKAMARVMLDEYAPQFAEKVMADAKAFIEKEYGPITKNVKFELPQTGGQISGITHEEFETVLSFVLADEPVMLIGPAGTGKNVICKQVAQAMNLDFYFSNAVTQEYKLTGFIDANGTFHETEFYKAFKNGGLFMLDEIDASIPEVLVILNAAIANRYFDFPNGKIEAHENFRVIAAGNTFGKGASYEYVGRYQLDGASLDRFAQVVIDYSPAIEASLTQDNELLKFVRRFRRACEENGINHIISYRAIKRMDKMANVLPIDKVLRTCLLKNLQTDDINMIRRNFIGKNRWEDGLRACAA